MRISDWSSDVCSSDLALQALGDGLEGDAPGHRLEAAGAVAQIRTIEPLARQAVTGMARLVVDPLLVHPLVQARQHAQHLAPAGVDADGRADGVQPVARVRLAHLPGSSPEGIRHGRAGVREGCGTYG